MTTTIEKISEMVAAALERDEKPLQRDEDEMNQLLDHLQESADILMDTIVAQSKQISELEARIKKEKL